MYQANQNPTGFAHMITGFMFDLKNPKELVIVSNKYDTKTKELVQKIRNNYSPNKITLFKDLSNSRPLEEIIPWISDYSMINDKPTFYVCENFTCKRPTTNIKTVIKFLNE